MCSVNNPAQLWIGVYVWHVIEPFEGQCPSVPARHCFPPSSFFFLFCFCVCRPHPEEWRTNLDQHRYGTRRRTKNGHSQLCVCCYYGCNMASVMVFSSEWQLDKTPHTVFSSMACTLSWWRCVSLSVRWTLWDFSCHKTFQNGRFSQWFLRKNP